ncbi:chromatin assembly factor 1 subunit A-B-like [Ischnura elegans]|uniref:chromatin assembly factor 1 subunit A-B-like n=1 Tax=Ischnura elegans TaxID=197161 RepID=UPI001ED873C7|nr:chromatin assembly factor 1 subunit A-B-like [Ischnura elegans]
MKTMDVPSGDVDDGTPVETPVKKLRQALLPFQIIGSGVSSSPSLSSKKRKLADESNNGKITKNIRLEKEPEAKENILVKPQKHDVKTTPHSSDEIKLKSNIDTPEEEETLCLRLDEDTNQPNLKDSDLKNANNDPGKAKEKEAVTSKKETSNASSNEVVEVSDSSDDNQAPSYSSIDMESADNDAGDANKTIDSKCEKSGLEDSDAKSSISGSEEGLAVLSSTDVSTPSRMASDSKSPTVVLKKRVLSSQMKEQRAKIKGQREKIKQEKKLEKERQREEKLAQKKKVQQERLSMKLEEKQKKEEERMQRKKQKEEERLKKEEKKEEERQKKEEERQKKEEERQKKEEEKQKKEEERQRKEEERLKREEEKKKEEEEEQKKKEKAAAAFASFFVPRKSLQNKVAEEQKVAERKFMPFMVKGDMRLAPIVRVNLNQKEKEEIEVKIAKQSAEKLYLDELKEKVRCPKTHCATWPLSELKDEVTIVEDEDDDVPPGGAGDGVVLETHQDLHLRAKLLQFCENQRPPYWGTWRKKSKKVRPRFPFQKDEKYFDYEVDSDDEWEEEEPGESLHGSDDEKESEDEYEVDNEFFVPHGYLSNEEAVGEDEDDVSPEMQKAKLKLLGMEFEEEMKQQTKQIKPQLLGCFWSFGKAVDENLNHQYERILMPYKAVVCCESIPTSFTAQNTSVIGSVSGGQLDGSSVGRKKSVFPERAIPDLIRLIHGNTNGWKFLVMEFLTHWKKKNDHVAVPKDKNGEEGMSPSSKSAISKLSITRKIKELASWIQFPEGSALAGRYAWCVAEETRAKFDLSDLSVPTEWKYNLKPVRKSESKVAPPTSPSVVSCEVPVESPSSSSTKPPLITKFTKVMSKEERLKQLKQPPKTSGASTQSPQAGSPSHQKSAPKVESAIASTSVSSSTKQTPVVSNGSDGKARKRVPLLVSVPRGQEIPKSYSLASFLKQSPAAKDSSSSLENPGLKTENASSGPIPCPAKDDDCIVLD